jgi:hypothetical protein
VFTAVSILAHRKADMDGNKDRLISSFNQAVEEVLADGKGTEKLYFKIFVNILRKSSNFKYSQ